METNKEFDFEATLDLLELTLTTDLEKRLLSLYRSEREHSKFLYQQFHELANLVK